MNLEDLREKLGMALADPRRRQLAHIAILEVAMDVGRALETEGLGHAEVEETTEEIAAYLKGERADPPPSRAGGDIVADALARLSQNSAFSALFK